MLVGERVSERLGYSNGSGKSKRGKVNIGTKHNLVTLISKVSFMTNISTHYPT